MAAYDLKLGRFQAVTVFDDLKEALGDGVELVGAGIAASDPRARPFPVTLPLHGAPTDTDPYASGLRIRRQLRALMENSDARMQGLYFNFAPDSELNGWLVAGGADLAYSNGGVSTSEFDAALTDVYKVASLRTYRPARRLELYDRRVSTQARDMLRTVFSVDFASQTALALNFLPVAVSDLIGTGKATVTQYTRAAINGNVGLVVGRTHAEVLSFEQAEADMNKGDVVVYDRQGNTTPTMVALPAASLDGYNRANGALGSNWTAGVFSGEAAGTIVSNARVGSGSWSSEWWNAAAYGPDGDVYATIRSGAGRFYLYLHLANEGTGSVRGYALQYNPTSLFVQRIDAGVETNLETINGITLAAGDSIDLRITGGTLRAWRKPAGGSWGALGTGVADSTYTFGHLGVEVPPGSLVLEDFGGGVDPQGSYGWEEVYGPDYPLTSGDVPVLSNGLCRVRYDSTNTPGFRVDAYVAGSSYLEQGKVTVQRRGDSTVDCNTLISAQVVEWTPERAVVLAVMRNASDAYSRELVYITLQRGWAGPRVEVYPAAKAAGTAAGAGVRWTIFAADTNDTAVKIDAGSAGAVDATAGSGSALWVGANVGASTFTGENWVAVLRTGTNLLTATLAVLTAGATAETANSSGAYGSARNRVLVWQASSGYISAQLGFHTQQANQIMEAESMTLGSGTTSVVDALASDGNSTQATRTADATHVSRNPYLAPYGAKYRVFVRLRTGGGSTTVSLYAQVTGTTGTTKTTTSTTYTWIDLGEFAPTSGPFEVHVWNSIGGAQAFRVDRVEMVKVEDRVAALYDGARDLGASILYQSRSVPELVAR